MSEKNTGGLVALIIAAPLMVICCGGGAVLLGALAGGAGAWLTGFGGLAVPIAAVGAALGVREFRRRRGHSCTGTGEAFGTHGSGATLTYKREQGRESA